LFVSPLTCYIYPLSG